MISKRIICVISQMYIILKKYFKLRVETWHILKPYIRASKSAIFSFLTRNILEIWVTFLEIMNNIIWKHWMQWNKYEKSSHVPLLWILCVLLHLLSCKSNPFASNALNTPYRNQSICYFRFYFEVIKYTAPQLNQ